MPQHSETRLLPYTPQQMFDLVADIEKYPEFLPWVIGARILEQGEQSLVATLVVGFKMLRETFTSRVTLSPPQEITVTYVAGPLKYLSNHWRFDPAPEGVSVGFDVAFAFRSRVFENIVGTLFSDAVRRTVSAFEKRADALYTAGKADLSKSNATRTA